VIECYHGGQSFYRAGGGSLAWVFRRKDLIILIDHDPRLCLMDFCENEKAGCTADICEMANSRQKNKYLFMQGSLFRR